MGLFVEEPTFECDWSKISSSDVAWLMLAIAIVFAYTYAMSWVGCKLIDQLIPMRVSAYSEKVGLDFSQHDEHYGFAHIGERELAEYEEHIREKEHH